MSSFKALDLNIVITRAFRANQAQINQGLLAWFSFNVVHESGIVLSANNHFTIRRGAGQTKMISSPFKVIYDEYAPEDIPDNEAVKPLYYTSFFPGDNPKSKELRREFTKNMIKAVYDKILFFEKQRGQNNESTNTSERSDNKSPQTT